MDGKTIIVILLILVAVGVIVYMINNKKMSLEQAQKMFKEDMDKKRTRILIHDGKNVVYNFSEEDLKQPKRVLYKNMKHCVLVTTGRVLITANGKNKADDVSIKSDGGSGKIEVDLKALQPKVFDSEYFNFSLN